jgi:hypothetical protein
LNFIDFLYNRKFGSITYLRDAWGCGRVLIDLDVLMVCRGVQRNTELRAVRCELLQVTQLRDLSAGGARVGVEAVHVRSDNFGASSRVGPELDEKVGKDFEVGGGLARRVVGVLLVPEPAQPAAHQPRVSGQPTA